MLLTHDLGRFIELRTPALENPLWRYVYSGKPKPFFHPLSTPAGHVISIFEPSDHVWHRGLWYAIKYINKEPFWEEPVDRPFGTQQTQTPPDVTHADTGEISVTSQVKWVRPHGEPIANEDRTFVYSMLDQDAYALDFTFALHFSDDVTLDRTPFITWGGYSGLTFRGNRNWTQTRLLFDDGSTSDRPTPVISKWCDLSGLIDGVRDTHVGIATFDHPSNPRHPTPWYGGTGPGHYYNAAFLFNQPLTLARDTPLVQRYRVIVHDHELSVDRLNTMYTAWCAR